MNKIITPFSGQYRLGKTALPPIWMQVSAVYPLAISYAYSGSTLGEDVGIGEYLCSPGTTTSTTAPGVCKIKAPEYIWSVDYLPIGSQTGNMYGIWQCADTGTNYVLWYRRFETPAILDVFNYAPAQSTPFSLVHSINCTTTGITGLMGVVATPGGNVYAVVNTASGYGFVRVAPTAGSIALLSGTVSVRFTGTEVGNEPYIYTNDKWHRLNVAANTVTSGALTPLGMAIQAAVNKREAAFPDGSGYVISSVADGYLRTHAILDTDPTNPVAAAWSIDTAYGGCYGATRTNGKLWMLRRNGNTKDLLLFSSVHGIAEADATAGAAGTTLVDGSDIITVKGGQTYIGGNLVAAGGRLYVLKYPASGSTGIWVLENYTV